MEHNEWYKKWFNTRYYHLLYSHRDEKEAEIFISNFIKKIGINKNSILWDNACGNGRHCYIFSKYGFNIVGTDICEENINMAKKLYSNPKTSFYIHDMRREFYINYFNGAINIFTSLGYFENYYDNQKAICVMANAVKKNGFVLIDFFNPEFIKNNLIPNETKVIDGVKFIIRRKTQNQKVIKEIEVIDGGQKLYFIEKVSLLTKDFFLNSMQKCGLSDIQIFGDYQFSDFNPKSSERMVFLGWKN